MFRDPSADQARMLGVICYQKERPNQPIGVVVLKNGCIKSPVWKAETLETVKIQSANNRLDYWEVTYVVRDRHSRGFCVGPICLGAAMDHIWQLEIRRDRQRTFFFWLLLAGGFENIRALSLYTRLGFIVRGIESSQKAPFLMTEKMGSEGFCKLRDIVSSMVEQRYLLPELKRQHLAQEVRSGPPTLTTEKWGGQDTITKNLL